MMDRREYQVCAKDDNLVEGWEKWWMFLGGTCRTDARKTCP